MLNIEKELTVLCETEGITGFESKATLKAEELLKRYCDKTEIDKFGNVFGYKNCGKKDAKTVLLDAHIDQIGFIVTEVLDGGFLKFTSVGGVDPRMLIGCEVTILTDEPCFGVISSTPPHLMKAGDYDKSVPVSEMVIDTGFENAKEKIKVGTPIVYREKVCSLSKGTITGKCLDDRAGVIALIDVLDKLQNQDLNVDIVVLISSQEEMTSLGATIGSYKIRPDFAIAVDVGHAKTPDAPSSKTFEFGGGAMIGMGPNLNTKFAKSLIKTAKKEDIEYQLEVMEGHTGTNAWTIQVVATGTAMALISIPLKYMHTQIETIKIKDLECVSSLIYQFLREFDGEVRL